jgi:hypothetical protein
MNNLTLKPAEGHNYQMFWNDSIEIGRAIIDVDGFYYFLPNQNGGGLWQSHVLKAIADKLDELNREINESINKYFEENGDKFVDGELDDLPF